MYTCLFEASKDGKSCIDPLFYHYPDNDELYKNIEHTFMVADAIKVSPVLEKDVDSFKSYFPSGNWVSLQNYSQVINVDDPKGKWVSLNATTEHV